MKALNTLYAGLAMACATLAGCGGGGDVAAPQDRQAGNGIAVGEPNGGVPVVSEFVKQAREASCATQRNRLYLIDDKYILADRAGACADAASSQVLMGAMPQAVLCQAGDTIAGPRSSCASDAVRPLFDTMLKHLDRPDLGLGAGHKVEYIPFLPKDETSLTFTPLEENGYSNIRAPRQVVVRDAASWARLWAEHGAGAGAAPGVDFSREMLAAVFAGDAPDGCKTVAVAHVVARGGKLLVEYVERDDSQVMMCAAVVGQPMQVVSLPRIDAPVEFKKVPVKRLALADVDAGNRSGVATARQVVVKDAGAWAALWAEHAGAQQPLPAIDFGRKMVIGVFLGGRSWCHGVRIDRAILTEAKVALGYREIPQDPQLACPAMVGYPAHLVTIDRQDVPVSFEPVVVAP